MRRPHAKRLTQGRGRWMGTSGSYYAWSEVQHGPAGEPFNVYQRVSGTNGASIHKQTSAAHYIEGCDSRIYRCDQANTAIIVIGIVIAHPFTELSRDGASCALERTLEVTQPVTASRNQIYLLRGTRGWTGFLVGTTAGTPRNRQDEDNFGNCGGAACGWCHACAKGWKQASGGRSSS